MEKYIESILLISDKAISIKELAKLLDVKSDKIKESIAKIQKRFNIEDSGIHLVESWGKVQFTTNPDCENIVKELVKEELNNNLSDASMETLTIIAYKGPITKSEIEQVRGVNCAMILKNLLIKGLINEESSKDKLFKVYNITTDFLKYLGINNIEELPNYEELSKNQIIEEIIEEKIDEQ